MQIPKDQIISLLQSRGAGDQAAQAAAQLPDQVDHEQHGDLLQQFGVNPQELVGQFGGQQQPGGGGQGQFGQDPSGQGQFGGAGDPGQGFGGGGDPGQGQDPGSGDQY